MELDLLAENLLKELAEIKSSTPHSMEQSRKSIALCRKLLNTFKKKVVVNGFTSISEEINFFKNIKSVPLSQLVYHKEIYRLELSQPKADKKQIKHFIQNHIQRLNHFFLSHIDFGQYLELGDTHLDTYYFTRKKVESIPISSTFLYVEDPEFSTPRDLMLAHFKAYGLVTVYLQQKLMHLKNDDLYKNISSNSFEKLPWPFTNTDWVELVYALSISGMAKRNNLSIMKVSNIMQEVFEFTPKDLYKTFQDIKARKISRTLFLDQLTTSLLTEMEKSEK
ncbi:RteC domain-containing protein [Maribacter polysiphoniae]|uniref:RteC domain-containing protein n=1 Tax=Maribacter polysiphoniae TaxID=429344 RepID=UPI002352E20A|nr:RteC domain-containing protein [Maribacter polysiphoniae]